MKNMEIKKIKYGVDLFNIIIKRSINIKEVKMVKEIQEINLEQYDKFREKLLRFFDLYKECEERSLLFSAMININFGAQDINRLIDKINSNKDYDSSWYYELIVKAYQILNAFDEIQNALKLVKSGYNDLYGQPDEADALNREKERQKIDFFRALRSLTTAHTLKTTDRTFKKFGISKGVYLEDVSFKRNMLFKKSDGDVVLEIRVENEKMEDGLGEIQYVGIWIEKDIIEPVRIIISKLELGNEKLSNLIQDKENELKNIEMPHQENIDKLFLEELKSAVIERYPREITNETYANGEMIEYWSIQEIFDFVNWDVKFNDERDLKLKSLQGIKQSTLYQYARDVQNMQLDYNETFFLSYHISTKGIRSYDVEKIQSYLSRSKNYPNLNEIIPYINNLSGASQMNSVSDETWACLLLLKLQPELDDYFKIEWENKTLQEIYWQYLVALFVRNKNSSL